jgi:hypothetical protein
VQLKEGSMKIETQGISLDYSAANGDFEPIDRGEVSKEELREIWKKVIYLSFPEDSDKCPPSVNVILEHGGYSCFSPDNGKVICTDTITEEMSVEEAIQLMCGELSIKDFDASKGNPHNSYKYIPFYTAVIGGVIGIFYLISNST